MTKSNQVARRQVLGMAAIGTLAAGTVLTAQASAQNPRQVRNHPRLARAIQEMEDTKEFLRKSPNVFGGYKTKAITALEVAIVNLKVAMQYAS